MGMKILGNTGFKVSRMCIGTDYAKVYGQSSIGYEILLKGFDLGINFWDTSESYGSYPAIRQALQILDRHEIVTTSKSYSKHKEGVKKDLVDALHAIDSEYLDIFMLRAVDTVEDFKSRKSALSYLLEVKNSGVIQALGTSTHSSDIALYLADVPEIEVVLTVLNMTGRDIRHGNLDQMHLAIKRLHDAGKGIYLMKVLARGKLASQAEEALRYAFKNPYTHAVSIGLTNSEELIMAFNIENEVSKKESWEM